MTEQHTFTRTDITFDSDGTSCAAWLYRPDGVVKPPVIVLAHGFAAIRDLGLAAYAERFAAAGYAAMVFDYRYWGGSGGQPRRVLDIASQQADWRSAVACARILDGVDTTRLVLWGSSFGGGHVLDLASRDHGIAAAIAQVPHVAGPASAFAQRPGLLLRLFAAAVRDQAGSWLRHAPYRVQAVGHPGDVAMMTSPGSMELVRRMAGNKAEELFRTENDVAARIALRVPFYSPGRRLSKITAPTLMQLAERDDVTPFATARKIAAHLPDGEVHSYDCSHFEPYLPPHFEQIISDQISFLDRRVR